MPNNHVSASSSFLCSPSNVGVLILFISPHISSTLDLLFFLKEDGLEFLCSLLLQCLGEWWWCLLTLMVLLFSSGGPWLLNFLEPLSLSNCFSIFFKLCINFMLKSSCCSLDLISLSLSDLWIWTSFYKFLMVFSIFMFSLPSSPCPLEFVPSMLKWTSIPLNSSCWL